MRAVWLILAIALASCQPADPKPDPTIEFGPDFLESQRAQCEADGGTFGGGEDAPLVCYRETGEGTKQCTSSNDCSGDCLARSRTCSPITPLLGCNDILDSQGVAITQCLE